MTPASSARILAVIAMMTTPLAAQRAPDTHAAVPEGANVAPVYPEMLREAGVGGVVRVTFVVDSMGRPSMASYKVHATANDLLSFSVKKAVQQWHFVPARRGPRPVPDSVEQVVEFVPSHAAGVWMLPPVVLARETLGPGRFRLVVGLPSSGPAAQPVADSLHMAIAAAALDTLLATLPGSAAYPPRIACIALGMAGQPVQPPLSLLRALSRPTYTVVASRRCPPTFGAMFRATYADGRLPEPDPPGEDPWAFTPLVPRAVNDSTVLIDIAMSHAGTMSGTYQCYAEWDRSRPGGWRAVCRAGRMAIH